MGKKLAGRARFQTRPKAAAARVRSVKFRQRQGRLHEKGVGTSLLIQSAPRDGFVEAGRLARVGAGHDEQVAPAFLCCRQALIDNGLHDGRFKISGQFDAASLSHQNRHNPFFRIHPEVCAESATPAEAAV